jgi:hypothetical protein
MPHGKSGKKRRLLWDVLAVFMQRGVHPNKPYGTVFPAKLFVQVEKSEPPVANLQVYPQISLRF